MEKLVSQTKKVTYSLSWHCDINSHCVLCNNFPREVKKPFYITETLNDYNAYHSVYYKQIFRCVICDFFCQQETEKTEMSM